MLSALRVRLEGLFPEDRPSVLFSVLDADIAAEKGGYPVLVSATDDAEQKLLQGHLPDAVALPPHAAAIDWAPEHVRQIERASVLIVTTTARQLFPQGVADLLCYADRSGTPIAIIVMEMGRVGDPEQVPSRAERQLEQFLSRSHALVCCIGDDRFNGPTLPSACADALRIREPAARTRELLRLRTEELRRLVGELTNRLTHAANDAARLTRLAIDTEHGCTRLAAATAASLSGLLDSLSNALRCIDVPRTVSDAIKKDGKKEEVSDRFTKALKQALVDALRSARSELSTRVERETSELRRHIANDLSRLGDLGLKNNGRVADCESFIKSVNKQVGELSSHVERFVTVPQLVLTLDRLTGHVKKKPGKAASPGGFVDSALKELPLRLLAGNLESAGFAMIEEGTTYISSEQLRLGGEWAQALEGLVSDSFAEVCTAASTQKAHAEHRRDLAAALLVELT